MKNWKHVKPTAVLVVICFVITLALAGTYQVTKPVIEAITKARADAARAEVLPAGAKGFSPMGQTFLPGVIDLYGADNMSGMVVTATERGYGGEVSVMVGIDNDGSVTGVKVLQHAETPGLGTKPMAEEHLAQFLNKKKISTGNPASETNIDAITGATLSSNAIYRAVENALKQYAEPGGGSNE